MNSCPDWSQQKVIIGQSLDQTRWRKTNILIKSEYMFWYVTRRDVFCLLCAQNRRLFILINKSFVQLSKSFLQRPSQKSRKDKLRRTFYFTEVIISNYQRGLHFGCLTGKMYCSWTSGWWFCKLLVYQFHSATVCRSWIPSLDCLIMARWSHFPYVLWRVSGPTEKQRQDGSNGFN